MARLTFRDFLGIPARRVIKQLPHCVVSMVMMALCTSQLSLRAQSITYKNIGSAGEEVFAVSGNNILGLVLGTSYFVFSGRTSTTLNFPGSNGTFPSSVSGNNVVGYYRDSSSNLDHGFLYNIHDNTYVALNVPGSFATAASSVDGNNVVGDYNNGGNAFLYNGSTYITLHPTGSTTNGIYASGISSSNVVGVYRDSSNSNVFHGFLYNGSTYVTIDPPGSSLTEGLSVSGNNIVGYYYDSNNVAHGFLYNGGAYTTINPPGSISTVVTGVSGNNLVGYYKSSNNVTHGFLYNGGTYTTLDPGGSTGTFVEGISGTNVVGYYNYPDIGGNSHGFLASGISAPVIAGVSPNPVIGNNGAQTFTINGSGFVSGCNVTLRDLTANQTFPNRTITTFSDSQILLNPIFTSSAHSWSVEVINPDFNTTGQFNFAVAPAIHSWTSRASGTSNGLNGIISGNSTIVAVGAMGTILTSTDGIIWTTQNSGVSTNLYSVTYGSGIFVVGGASGTILTSPDGINWTSRSSAFAGNIYALTYGNDLFIAAGMTGDIQSSPDGINWTDRGLYGGGGSSTLYGATYANGLFVVDGVNVVSGIGWTSTDGVHWSGNYVNSSAANGVAYGDWKYVVVGNSGAVETSPDVGHWTAQQSGATNKLSAICYGNGFITVGQNGTILDSTDGVSWTANASGSGNNLNAAVYANGTFLVVGNSGTILQSNSIPTSGPLISSVNPNPVPAQSGQQTFSINGSNFATGCTVTLRNLGTGQSFANVSITSQNSSEIVLSQNFSMTPATWTAQVIDAQGTSSGQYRFQVGTGVTPTLAVTALNSTTFIPVQLGASSTNTFTLTNNGTTVISGTAAVTGPFAIEGTATYTLQPGGYQTFTIQFLPTGVGFQTGYLSFSGGTGATIQLSGSSIAATPFGSVAGKVLDTNGNPVQGATITASGGSATSTTSLSDGSFKLINLPASTSTSITVQGPGNSFFGKVVPNISVVAGSPTSIANIQLAFLPDADGPAAMPQNIPVVFIRGIQFGLPQHAPPDSYWDFNSQGIYDLLSSTFTNLWDPNGTATFSTTDFQMGHLETATQTIIDGTKDIDYNAEALVAYLTTQIQKYEAIHNFYPPSIDIVAHSMGGLFVRRALDNRSYFQCSVNGSLVKVPVNLAIMLGTPNVGTKIADADVFAHQEALSPSLFADFSFAPVSSLYDYLVSYAALSSFSTDTMTKKFNPEFSWPNSVPIYLMAGTGGGTEIPATGTGAGLDLVHNTLARPNDGVVIKSSVYGEISESNIFSGTVTVSKSVDFGPKATQVTDQEAAGVLVDHTELLSNSAIQGWVMGILQTGNHASLALRATDVKAAVDGTAPTPTQQFDSQSGSVMQGSSVNVHFASDAESILTVNVITDSAGLGVSLLDPSGNAVNPASEQSNANVTYTQTTNPGTGIVSTSYTITNAAKGAWTTVLDGSAVTQGSINYEATISGDSSVVWTPITSSFFHNGRESVISGSLEDLSATPHNPVPTSSITAQILYPDGTTNTQTLLDDGFHSDGVAGDGVYAAVLPNLTEPGQYFVTYRVTGSYGTNRPYSRYTTGLFTVSSEDAAISGQLSSSPVPSPGSGVSASMSVNCWVTAVTSGNYRLSGQLVDSSGTHVISTSVEMVSVAPGTTTATLNFDLTQFLQANFTGTAKLTNVQLFEQTADGLQWLDAYPGSYSIQIGPQITSQPTSKTVAVGGSVQLSVGSIGDPSMSYQWLFKGTPIMGQTASNISLSNVMFTEAGNYSVTVTDETGAVTSSDALLTVQQLITFSDWATANVTSDVPAATPQGDGIPNLLKYLYDINPSAPMTATDRAALPTIGKDTTTNPGTEYLTLTYRQNALKTGITLNVQSSTDLQTWRTVTPDLSQQLGTDAITGDPIMEVGVIMPANTAKQFIRMNVTQP